MAAEWCRDIVKLFPVPGPMCMGNFKIRFATVCSGSDLLHWVSERHLFAVSAAIGSFSQIEELWAYEIVPAKAMWCDKSSRLVFESVRIAGFEQWI